jgi:hypothetical protein
MQTIRFTLLTLKLKCVLQLLYLTAVLFCYPINFGPGVLCGYVWGGGELKVETDNSKPSSDANSIMHVKINKNNYLPNA